MNHEEIIQLTHQYGGDWAINHAKRNLHLISLISDGIEYDHEAIFWAAYMHDWGGYTHWLQEGVEHQIRSRQVAEKFLAEHNFEPSLSKKILDCIEYHHGGPADRCIESILFTDADALDILGVVGTLRIFAMKYRNLKDGYNAVIYYRDLNKKIITLEKSKLLAEKRFAETEQLLKTFEDETFGMF